MKLLGGLVLLHEQTPEDMIELFARIKSDPWEFSKYVFTIDEATRQVRRFPWEKPHVKLAFRMMQQERMLLVPKSRRMHMTWVTCVFILWDTMFHSNVHSAVCSKKEEAADWLIEYRIKFVYDNLDPAIPRQLLPRMNYTYNLMTFEGINSKIQGFPQGEDQLRMYTLSNIFADELAFWEKAEGTYKGAKPCLEGGGRFIGISSAAPGFFKDMVYDTVDHDGRGGGRFTPPKKHIPMQGIEIWKNLQNQFTVLQIHYTADPGKRSKEFLAEIKRGIKHSAYLQEYEIEWDTYTGMPVYDDFNKAFHGSQEEIFPHIGVPLLRGWDFGLTPACIVAQYREGELVILREYVEIGMGIDRFADKVQEDLRIRYPQWADQKRDYFDFIDPSGNFKKDTDEKSCADFMVAKGMNPRPGDVTWEKRRSSVDSFLTEVKGGKPVFRVNLANCDVLVRGFLGGYRYPDKVLENEKARIRPIKNEFSHPHDALQMITGQIKVIIRKANANIPSPSYHSKRISNGR